MPGRLPELMMDLLGSGFSVEIDTIHLVMKVDKCRIVAVTCKLGVLLDENYASQFSLWTPKLEK